MSELGQSIDETITAAVKARIEASVLEALSGDQFLQQFIASALQRPVEVQKKTGYGTERMPFVTHLLEEAMRGATEVAARQVIAERHEEILAAVRAALTSKIDTIAATLTDTLVNVAEKPYGFNVTLEMRMPNS